MNNFDNNFSNSPEVSDQTFLKPRWYEQKSTKVLLAMVLLIAVFRFGYQMGQEGFTFSPKDFKIVNSSGQPTQVDYGLLWKVLGIIDEKYIDKNQLDQQKILYGAIKGAVEATGDEYSEFFDPETFAEFKTELQGSFSGIGAEVGRRDGNITIIAPIDGSPASQSGLLPADIILAVNGETLENKTLDQAVRLIRGEEGTQVTLNIYREGRDVPFDVSITRAQIEIKSVKVDYRNVNGQEVAILEISRFGDDTENLFDQAVTDILKHGVSKLVLDLRSNPGGYLDTAVNLASDWLPEGTLIVKEEHSQNDVINYNSDGSNRLGNLKTIVLVDQGSASASEILAGALRDNGVSQLIGMTTYGKGSVQELVPIGDDSALKITVAKWITPNGQNLNHDGLKPDIEVEISEDDYLNKRDPQLDRALEEIIK
ncbi:MAG: S41 family peptidase [Candidatus Doudnabacteria bacterium]